MAVPEPAAGFGLWPRVRAVTGWVESDEDALLLLGEDLRQAGTAFESAGGQSLTPARQAWGDDVGGMFVTQAAHTLTTATTVGGHLTTFATTVDDFATTVRDLKTNISATIARYDPVYGALGLLPPIMAGGLQTAFAAQVATQVNGMITGAAGRAGGQAAAPAQALPPPLPAGPRAGAPPQENAAWWAALSPEDKLRFVNEKPELVAGLDGLPTEARDDANRIVLDRDIAGLRQQVDGLRAQDAALGRGPGSPPSEFALLAQHLDERREALANLRDELEPDVAYDPNRAPGNDQRFYLLGFDDEGDGRALVARGNPDIAANVATLVPGIMNDVTTVARSDGQTILERIDALHGSAARAGSPSTSVIAWLDYDAPSEEGVLGTFSGAAADDARQDLISFQQGLRASHVGPVDSHNTIIGHSYGSLVAGAAARDGDLQVNDFVAVGSLGVGTQHASELRVPNVWVTENDDDVFADLGIHGMDPSDIRFEAKVFESDPAPGVTLPGGAHSGAFDDVPGNVGLDNLGRIIATRDGQTYPEVLHRVPVVDLYAPDSPSVDYDPP